MTCCFLFRRLSRCNINNNCDIFRRCCDINRQQICATFPVNNATYTGSWVYDVFSRLRQIAALHRIKIMQWLERFTSFNLGSVNICVFLGDVALNTLTNVATTAAEVVPQNPQNSGILFDFYIRHRDVIDPILLDTFDAAAEIVQASMAIVRQFILLLGETALVPLQVVRGFAVTNVSALIKNTT